MIYIENPSIDPFYNAAFESYCFRQLRQFDAMLIIWQNAPSVIIGKHQNAIEEVNIHSVYSRSLPVIRRISGGGAVYHDAGNLNYTLIINASDNIAFDPKSYAQCVADALVSMGVDAVRNSRNDIVVGDRKVCGHAQACLNGRMLHHGCILLDADLDALSDSLRQPEGMQVISRGVKSVRSRVTNTRPLMDGDYTIDDLRKRLLACFLNRWSGFTEYQLSNDEQRAVQQLRNDKFSDWGWNWGQSPACTLTRTVANDRSRLTIAAELSGAEIQSISFSEMGGDDQTDWASVSAALVGAKFIPAALQNKLEAVAAVRQSSVWSAARLSAAITGG